MTGKENSEQIKNGDFISLDFVGTLKATNLIFDTTQEDVAKKEGIYNDKMSYKPLIIKVGENQLIKSLDEFLVGKKIGKYSLDLPAEKAFGKKNAKLLRLFSISEFRKHKISPMPGLEVELDGMRGIIRTVNGGRVIVDFNHPLSGQDIIYDLQVNQIITDEKTKLEATLGMFQLPYKKVELSDNKAKIELVSGIPKELTEKLVTELEKVSGVKNIEFTN